MIAIVDSIMLFFKGMNGWKPCPRCGNRSPMLVSTTSIYENYCPSCDIRYTNDGEIYA